VDAAKIKLELIEFQQNVAVKEIFFDDTPEDFLSIEGISNFFPLFANSQWKFLRCLGLPAAGGTNCPLLPAIVNVKLGPPLGLYFSFSILLVFSSFLRFSEYLLVI